MKESLTLPTNQNELDAPDIKDHWYDQVDIADLAPEAQGRNCFIINLGRLAGTIIAIDFGIKVVDDNLDAPQQEIKVSLIDWPRDEDDEPYREQIMDAAKAIAADMIARGNFAIK